MTDIELSAAVALVGSIVEGATDVPAQERQEALVRSAWVENDVDPRLSALRRRVVDVGADYMPMTTNLRDLRHFSLVCGTGGYVLVCPPTFIQLDPEPAG